MKRFLKRAPRNTPLNMSAPSTCYCCALSGAENLRTKNEACRITSDKHGNRQPSCPHLQELEIGVILIVEQIDVRRVLLADSPVAPSTGARTSLQIENFLLFVVFLFSVLRT